jgi:uncharacterized protein
MLLDVNVILALAWPNHQFHGQARSWFAARATSGWSTCALTQLGFIRISSNPAFTPHAKTPQEAALLLASMTSAPGHRYLESLPEPAHRSAGWQHVAGHRQTTDAYLVHVARHHGIRLATFDGRMRANRSAVDVLEVIAP